MADARVGRQGTLTRVRAKRGARPRAPCDTRYQWACIFGAVRPERGVAAGLVMPFADTGAPLVLWMWWLLCEIGATAWHVIYDGQWRGSDRSPLGHSGPLPSMVAPVFFF